MSQKCVHACMYAISRWIILYCMSTSVWPCKSMYVCMYVCMYALMYVTECVHVCMHAISRWMILYCMSTSMASHIYACMYVYIRMCVRMLWAPAWPLTSMQRSVCTHKSKGNYAPHEQSYACKQRRGTCALPNIIDNNYYVNRSMHYLGSSSEKHSMRTHKQQDNNVVHVRQYTCKHMTCACVLPIIIGVCTTWEAAVSSTPWVARCDACSCISRRTPSREPLCAYSMTIQCSSVRGFAHTARRRTYGIQT